MLDQDDDFVSICDFARHYYYDHKWQIMPLSPRSKVPPTGFAAIDLQKGLLDKDTFEKMWGPGGAFVINNNCGVLCGFPSGGLFVVDLDTAKPGSRAQAWWDDIHAMRPHPETPTQITGSGGTQIFFKMPEGMKAFNHKNAYLNVDFQGEGAYVVLPPSIHPNGNRYRWVDGMSPDECDIMVLPDYLIEEITAVIGDHGGPRGTGGTVKTDSPSHQTDEWGKIVDGREDLMTRMIFRCILQLYRDCPIIPTEEEQAKHKKNLFETYVDATDSRIHEPGTPKHMLLERENRGITLFNQKWRATIKQWDDKICREAARPWVHDEPKRSEETSSSEKISVSDPETDRPGDLFRVWTINDLKNQPPAVWLWEDIIVEGGSHYFAANPGVGKTFVGMGLAAAIASGMDRFLGRKINKHGLVVYITTEGLYDHYKRLNAFEKHYGVTVEEKNYIVIPDAMNLLNERDRSRLMRTLSWEVKIRGVNPLLVVFDTVSRVIPGANENDIKDMGLFVKAKADIKQAFNCSDLNMHHRAKAGDSDMRGSGGLQGEADGVYVMEREAGEEVMIFRAAKIKAAPDGWEFEIIMKPVEIDAFSSSLVPILPQGPSQGSGDAGFGGKQETGFQIIDGHRWPSKEICEKVLDAIQAAAIRKEPWSNSEKARDYGRYAAARIKNMFSGINEDLANLMIRTWLNNDVLETYIYDTRNKKPGLRKKVNN